MSAPRDSYYVQSYDDMFDDDFAGRGIVRSAGSKQLQKRAAVAPTSQMQNNTHIDMGGIPDGALETYEARKVITTPRSQPNTARSKTYWRTMSSFSAS